MIEGNQLKVGREGESGLFINTSAMGCGLFRANFLRNDIILLELVNVIDHRAARITGGHLFFGVLRIQPPSNKMPS